MKLPDIECQPLPNEILIELSDAYSTILEYHDLWKEYHDLWKEEESNRIPFVQFLQNEGFDETTIHEVALSFWNKIRSFFGGNSISISQNALRSLYALLDIYEIDLENIGLPEPQEYFLEQLFAKMQTTDGLYDFFGSLFNKTLTRERVTQALIKVAGSEEWVQKISDDFKKRAGRILQKHGTSIGGPMVESLKHNPYIPEDKL